MLFARITDHEWSLTLEVRQQSSEGVVMTAGESTPENTDGTHTRPEIDITDEDSVNVTGGTPNADE